MLRLSKSHKSISEPLSRKSLRVAHPNENLLSLEYIILRLLLKKITIGWPLPTVVYFCLWG